MKGSLTKNQRRKRSIIDFTTVDTIFKHRSVRTVSIKVDRLLLKSKTIELETISGYPDEVFEILKGIFDRLDDHQEHLVLLTLDLSQDVKGFKVISSGSHHSIEIDEAIIYRNALLLGASSIILAHNHPGEDVTPSQDDIITTVRLVRIGNDLRIPMVDHIIYTHDKCMSMRIAHPHVFR